MSRMKASDIYLIIKESLITGVRGIEQSDDYKLHASDFIKNKESGITNKTIELFKKIDKTDDYKTSASQFPHKKIKESPTTAGASPREDDNINVDHLIPKLNLVYYGDNDTVSNIENFGGLYTPKKMLEKFPEKEETIRKIYGDCLDCPIRSNSVFAFLSRVPEGLPTTKQYIENNTPVRISVSKLTRATTPYKIYGINIPGHEGKIIKLSKDDIDSLTKKEDIWYKSFKNSNDKYFRDVPQVAIYCRDGILPAFTCKILKGE